MDVPYPNVVWKIDSLLFSNCFPQTKSNDFTMNQVLLQALVQSQLYLNLSKANQSVTAEHQCC